MALKTGKEDLEAELEAQLDQIRQWFSQRLEHLLQSNQGLVADNAALRTAAQDVAAPVDKGAKDMPVGTPSKASICIPMSATSSTHSNVVKDRVPRLHEAWASDGHSSLAPPKRSTARMRRAQRRSHVVETAIQDRGEAEQSSKQPLRTSSTKSALSTLGCRFPTHPMSLRKVLWDAVTITVLFFDFVTIPLGVYGISDLAWFRIASYAVVSFWTLDMAVQFTTGYVAVDGKTVMDWKCIVKRYLKSWFLIDVTIVGSEWFVIVLNAVNSAATSRTGVASYARVARVFRTARLVRLMRLVRLAKLREFLCRCQEYMASEYLSILWGVAGNIAVLLMLNHVCACLFYWVGTHSDSEEKTWVKRYELEDSTILERYITSLHWSLTQFTPASMSVQPQNLVERVYAVVVLIMAMIMFSTFVSSVTAGMTRLRALQAEWVQDAFKLRRFLRQHNISQDLAYRVDRYIAIVAQNRKHHLPRSAVRQLSYLSGPLNIELQYEMFASKLLTHKFFEKCSVKAMLSHMCCVAVNTMCISRRDVVFSRSTASSTLYLLHDGSAGYKVSKKSLKHTNLNKRFVRVGPDTWLGEAVLWVPWKHRGTLQALTECDLITIDHTKFEEVVVAHEQVHARSKDYAAEFIQTVTYVVEHHGDMWDLPLDWMAHLGSRDQLCSDEARIDEDAEYDHIWYGIREMESAEHLEAQLLTSDSEVEEELEAEKARDDWLIGNTDSIHQNGSSPQGSLTL